ncbi:MAG TPA: orotidine-5'-phosphate decarboxylase [Micrococcaceae bacterium]|nr:orotidine-5'-phosphate decarboxylase [Micrococcaceae bacterium]
MAKLPAGSGRDPFGARLALAMDVRGPLCVGIDPHPALLKDWGLGDTPEGLRRFSHTVLEAVGSVAAAIKPQVALYERHGSAGLAVLEELLAAAAGARVLSIADAKRGDIGSTMAAYADAWLRDGSALAADAVTLSPYLGFESLRPALDLAAASGRGVFVLALTSNPEGASVQHVGGTDSVAKRIVAAAGAENRLHQEIPPHLDTHLHLENLPHLDASGSRRTRIAGTARDGMGHVGLVVGATVGSALTELNIDLQSLHGPILAPGLGAQGATAEDIRTTFGPAYPQVLGTSSRGILAAGPDLAALRNAAQRTLDGLRSQ